MDGVPGDGARRFYGKYRGKVENTLDPLQLGRVQVSCPAVLGEGTLSWALPCTPYAGNQVGLFLVPPVGAHVWVEFEGGDPYQPIVGGCFWGTGEVPASPAVEQVKLLRTDAITLRLSDVPGGGGVTVQVGSPAVAVPVDIKATSTGVEISMGKNKIALTAASVSINDGALEVT
ncbi:MULTISPECIES: phage baseplate assembly protein V [unclassified Isoptericola]|uniref:phage baseplate assembly protein V n=1 Tax=unclassified Isoptericola TaxID=2623355 RepID=UPI003658950E